MAQVRMNISGNGAITLGKRPNLLKMMSTCSKITNLKSAKGKVVLKVDKKKERLKKIKKMMCDKYRAQYRAKGIPDSVIDNILKDQCSDTQVQKVMERMDATKAQMETFYRNHNKRDGIPSSVTEEMLKGRCSDEQVFAMLDKIDSAKKQLKKLDWNSDELRDNRVTELILVTNYYHISDNPTNLKVFIGQCSHETCWGAPGDALVEKGGYDYCEGLYGYQKAKGKELGNTEEGDGAKYRGAGYVHLTGKNNYKKFSEAMGDENILTEGHEYVAENYGWEAAGWFWDNNNMNKIGNDNKDADSDTLTEKTTMKINSGEVKSTKESTKENYKNRKARVKKAMDAITGW